MRAWKGLRSSGGRAAARLALVCALSQGGFMIPAQAQPAERPDLTGRVVVPRTASGVPKVMVFGAAPKGGGALSLAYPDCAKSVQPDADGQFKIPSLDPELKFRLLIVAPGCKPQVIQGLDPAGGPVTSFLESADTNLTTIDSVRGLVLDGKSAPVADALVVLAGVRRDDRSAQAGTPRPGYPIAVTDAQGQFVLSSQDPYPGHPKAKVLEVTAEIEARGFVKQKAAIEVGGAAIKVVLAEGGRMIEGTVLLPDGRPAEGASVALKKAGKRLNLRDGRLAGAPNDNIGITDAAGHFVLPSDADATALFAAHAAGLGKIATNSVIISGGTCRIDLQPWGRIEGEFKIGSLPGTNVAIELASSGDLSYSSGTTTDSTGRFTFTDVPQGELRINRRHPQGNGTILSTMLSQVVVKPGEVARVTLDGTGRAIVGKVVVMPPGEKVDWSLVQMSARANNRYYVPSLAGDGSFRVEDIPAGTYQLSVDARERSTGLSPFAVVGEVEKDVLVPEMPGGRSDEPLDVGTIEVPIHHLPAAGVKAADFAAKTLDGQPLKLSDYRGKFVLLDLARKLPGTETPSVEAAAQDFAAATNFAVITLCNDADPDFLAALSQKKLPWITGKLGDLNLAFYGVNLGGGFFGANGGFGGGGPDLPAVLLIGPDGKYVDGRLKAAGIQDAVKAVLGAK